MVTGSMRMAFRALVAALKAAGVVADGRGSYRMSKVLLVAREGEVAVTGFDGDRAAVTVAVPAIVSRPGLEVAVEQAKLAKLLAGAVKGGRKAELDRLDVRLDVDTEQIQVGLAGFTVPLECQVNPEDFPKAPDTTPPTHVMDRERFVAVFGKVKPSVGTDELLHVFTKMRLELNREAVELLGTDRYRLSIGKVPASGTCEEEAHVPAIALAKLLPVLSGEKLAVGVDRFDNGDRWVTIVSDDTTVRVRDDVDNYPKIRHLAEPATDHAIATMDRDELHRTVTRAAAITTVVAERHAPVLLRVTDTHLTVNPGAQAGDTTAPEVPATVEGHPGEEWISAVNPTYLAELVTAMAGPTVTLHLGQPHKPLIFEDADGDRHVVMPQRRPN